MRVARVIKAVLLQPAAYIYEMAERPGLGGACKDRPHEMSPGRSPCMADFRANYPAGHVSVGRYWWAVLRGATGMASRDFMTPKG